jgi:ribosomal protein L29
MKTRDIKELHTKTLAELGLMLKDRQMSLRNDRLELAQRKLTNTSSITNNRHDIARLKTIMQQKRNEALMNSEPEAKTVDVATAAQAKADKKAKAGKKGNA